MGVYLLNNMTNMKNTIKLNADETLVLKAIVNASYKYTRGCFTYFYEVMEFVTDLTEQQVKGYISQLTQKNAITISIDEYNNAQINPSNQFESFTQYTF